MPDLNTDMSGLGWLTPTETPGQALTRGVSAGSLIAQSYLHAQQLRQQQQLELQKEAALAPLRQAQTEYYLQKTSLDLKTEADKAQQDIDTRRGFSELSGVISNVGKYPEKWLDPNFEHDFWQVASDYPEVTKDKAFDNVLSNFVIAQKAKAAQELADKNNATRERNTDVRAETSKENTRTAGELRNEGIVLRGGTQLEIAQLKASVSQAEGAADKILNQAMKATYLRQLDVIKGDGIMTSDQKQAAILKLARQYNLGTIGFPDKSAAGLPAPAVAPVAPAGPARPTTQAEYNALPPGTVYIHPSTGEAKQKP